VRTTTTTPVAERWTAAELRRMPAHDRDSVLLAAAEQAEVEYRTNPELTAFEALGKDDLPVDRSRSLAAAAWPRSGR